MKSHVLSVISKGIAIPVLTSLSVVVCFFVLFSADERYVLAPIVATLFIVFLFWRTLSHRRGEIPLADPGTFTVLAMACYTLIPLLQFLLSGMEHTTLSAFQLYVLAPTPKEFGAFSWWYVVYLLSFVIAYLVSDSKINIFRGNPIPPDQGTVRCFLILFIILSAIMFAVEAVYGINLYGVYDFERLYDSYETFLQMPLLFRQFYGIIGHIGILFIVRVGILLTIFLNWEKYAYRYALYAWLLVMLVSNVLWMGARTEYVLTFLAVAIMYHRFVKPLRLAMILPAGIILFAVFMTMGMMRGATNLGANLEYFRSIIDSSDLIFSTSNEFQVLFGGNYDLLKMKQGGLLGEVPLQAILYDPLMLIPQQILPFEKLDVQQWVRERSMNPGYFMFNPISQSIIGFGWAELILRGVFLGFIFAKTRAWYVRRATSFWVTLLYFYIILISYYTVRGTAIYILLVSVIFRFIPLYLFVKLIANRRRGTRTPVPVSSSIVGE